MSGAVIGRFATAERLCAALAAAEDAGLEVLDAYSPYPLPETMRRLAPDWTHVRLWALAAAVAAAVGAYAIQWWSSVKAYPLNTGSRPLDSWPVYLLTVFEVAVLAGAVGGVAAFLFKAGLPRLNHPIFSLQGFERATQDRFFLALAAPPRDAVAGADLVDFLMRQGAEDAEGAEL